MKFFWLIILFLIQKSTIIMQAQILHELVNNLNPYGVVIFTDDAKQKISLKSISNQNPAAIINLNKVNHTNINRSFEMSIFQNPRRSAVYIILLSKAQKHFKYWTILSGYQLYRQDLKQHYFFY